MAQAAKRSAFDSNSVAELAIAFVISSALILLLVFAAGAFVWYILLDKANATDDQTDRLFFLSAWTLWFMLNLALWIGIRRRIRRTPDIDLSDSGFFKFQISAALCVMSCWLLLHIVPTDIPQFTATLSTLFEALLAMFTVVYLSFAWTARKKVPAKIYLGFALNIAALFAGKL